MVGDFFDDSFEAEADKILAEMAKEKEHKQRTISQTVSPASNTYPE